MPLYPPRSDATGAIRAYLNNPLRITRAVQELAADRFFADRILRGRGTSVDGAVHYQQNQTLLPDRASRTIEPGGRFPLTDIARGVPLVEPIGKFGLATKVTLERVNREGFPPVEEAEIYLRNGVVDDFDSFAMGIVNAVTTNTVTGSSWAAATPKTVLQQIIAAIFGVNHHAGGYNATHLIIDAADAAVVFADEVIVRGLQALPNPVDIIIAPVGVTSANPTVIDADLFGSIVNEDLDAPGTPAQRDRRDSDGVRVVSQYHENGPDGDQYWWVGCHRNAHAIVRNPNAAVRITGTG